MRSQTIFYTVLLSSTITAAKIAYEKYTWPGIDEDGNSNSEDLLGNCYVTIGAVDARSKSKPNLRVKSGKIIASRKTRPKCGFILRPGSAHPGAIFFCEEAFLQGNEYNATGKEVETSVEPFFPPDEWDTLDDPKWVPKWYAPCKEKLDAQIKKSSFKRNSTFCETDDEPCHCTHEEQLTNLAECLMDTCPEERDVETALWLRTLHCADDGIIINRSAFLAGMNAEKADLKVQKAENETEKAESEAEKVEPESSAAKGAVGFGMFALTTVGVLMGLI